MKQVLLKSLLIMVIALLCLTTRAQEACAIATQASSYWSQQHLTWVSPWDHPGSMPAAKKGEEAPYRETMIEALEKFTTEGKMTPRQADAFLKASCTEEEMYDGSEFLMSFRDSNGRLHIGYYYAYMRAWSQDLSRKMLVCSAEGVPFKFVRPVVCGNWSEYFPHLPGGAGAGGPYWPYPNFGSPGTAAGSGFTTGGSSRGTEYAGGFGVGGGGGGSFAPPGIFGNGPFYGNVPIVPIGLVPLGPLGTTPVPTGETPAKPGATPPESPLPTPIQPIAQPGTPTSPTSPGVTPTGPTPELPTTPGIPVIEIPPTTNAPEPASVLLLAAGLVGLYLVRRYRKRKFQ